jgi:hypothetical protein
MNFIATDALIEHLPHAGSLSQVLCHSLTHPWEVVENIFTMEAQKL